MDLNFHQSALATADLFAPRTCSRHLTCDNAARRCMYKVPPLLDTCVDAAPLTDAVERHERGRRAKWRSCRSTMRGAYCERRRLLQPRRSSCSSVLASPEVLGQKRARNGQRLLGRQIEALTVTARMLTNVQTITTNGMARRLDFRAKSCASSARAKGFSVAEWAGLGRGT